MVNSLAAFLGDVMFEQLAKWIEDNKDTNPPFKMGLMHVDPGVETTTVNTPGSIIMNVTLTATPATAEYPGLICLRLNKDAKDNKSLFVLKMLPKLESTNESN